MPRSPTCATSRCGGSQSVGGSPRRASLGTPPSAFVDGAPTPNAVLAAPVAATDALLRVRDLDVDYDGVQVLFGVDFDAGAGEIVALLGTNGSGKSTLLAAVSGLRAPTRGTVTIGGRRHHARAPGADRRPRCGTGARRTRRLPVAHGRRQPAPGDLARARPRRDRRCARRRARPLPAAERARDASSRATFRAASSRC